MVLSAVGGFKSPVEVTATPTANTDAIREITKKEVEIVMSTERYIRNYFSDIPIMIQIAKCESHFKQLDNDGNVHRGEINPEDVGVMQINEHYHLDEASSAKIDIYTLEGNTTFARMLYEKEGTRPWNSSKACWGKYENQGSLAIKNSKNTDN